MKSGSIIIFGILAAFLLILSCITLNASRFYNELEMSTSSHFISTPRLVLRDRN